MKLVCRTVISLLSTYSLQDVCVASIILFESQLPADVGILALYQNLLIIRDAS